MARSGRGLALVVAFAGLAIGAALWVHFDRLLTQPRQMAIRFAQIAPPVTNTLGEPLEFGRFPQAKLHGGNGEGNVDMSISVSGPLGSGTLIEWAQQSAGQWHICSLVFRPDRRDGITLVDSSQTHCEPE
jgi:hypothetical protein